MTPTVLSRSYCPGRRRARDTGRVAAVAGHPGLVRPGPAAGPGRRRALPPRRRMLDDLHRAATHANLPLQQTPMSQAVTKVLRGRIESNALKHKPSTRAGVMITGGGYQGKTETACEIAADFEDAWLELHHHLNPDAVPGPGTCTPRSPTRRPRSPPNPNPPARRSWGSTAPTPRTWTCPTWSARSPRPSATTAPRRCCWMTSPGCACTAPMTRTCWT